MCYHENMDKIFLKKWQEVVKKKKSLIIAGIDPTREIVGEKNLFDWCKKYLESVAPHVAGVKVNPKYFFKFPNGNEVMKYIAEFCKKEQLVSIFDEKLSEVGHSNFEGVIAAAELGFDSVTIAAFASNASEVVDFCEQNNVASINMGLMSNEEFSRESEYKNPQTGKTLWQDRLQESLNSGVSALVLGGTFSQESSLFRNFLKQTEYSEVLFLVPGLGAQGGDPEEFLKSVTDLGMNPKRFMLNLGRSLMNALDKEKYLTDLNKRILETFVEKDESVSEIKRLK